MRVGASSRIGNRPSALVNVLVMSCRCSRSGSSKPARRRCCRSRRDSCGPSDPQTPSAPAAFLPCLAAPCGFPANTQLLPGCGGWGRPFWKNFFFFRPWFCSRAAGCPAACLYGCGGGAAFVWLAAACACCACGAPLAGFILAAAPAAPMPLRLPLAVGRGWPQIGLRLRRFCRHACTSWHFAIWCIALPGDLSFLI